MPQVAEKNTVEVKTITTKRVPAGETENGSANEPRVPWDEYLLDLSSTDWLHHEVRVYRREPAAMRGLLGVFQEPINETYLMKNYGGGEYWITIKRNGKSDKYVCEKVQIAGEPKRENAGPAPSSGVRSDWQFPGSVVTEFTVMLVILGLWLWNSRAPGSWNSRMALLVILCMIVPFLAGVLVRVALGSYRAVQESGFIGVGRIAATALLIYGTLARGLLSPQGERMDAPASAGEEIGHLS